MRTDEIIAELTERYPGGSHFDVKDVTDFFMKLKGQDTDTVYHCIIRNHDYSTFPKLPKIRKYIEKDNVKIGYSENDTEKYYYYICDVCKTHYSIDLGNCPVCKKHTDAKVFITDVKNDNAMTGRNGCSGCKEYSTRAMCPTCQDWGKGIYSEACSVCQGLDCCKDFYDRNKNKMGLA
jgi:hypothetical protein